MIKKTKVLLLALIVLVSLTSIAILGGCGIGSDYSRYWRTSECDKNSNLIIVTGPNSRGQRRAERNDGVLNFPLEVNGRSEFEFAAGTSFPGGAATWNRFNVNTNLIIFPDGFQGSNLSFSAPREDHVEQNLWVAIQFNGRQDSLFRVRGTATTTLREIIYAQNSVYDFYEELIYTFGQIPSALTFKLGINS